MTYQGMNVETVRLVSRDLDRQAAALESVARQIDNLLAKAERDWRGNDAREFEHRWRQIARPGIVHLADALSGLARSARSNADAQEKISDDDQDAAGPDDRWPSPEEQSRAWLETLPKTNEGWRDSLAQTNPRYGELSQQLSTVFASFHLLDSTGEYRNNCGYASIAYDLRRRGYDVEAQPDLDGDGHVRYLDPQSNAVDVTSYFKDVSPGAVRIMRTDDLLPNMNPTKYYMVGPDEQ